MKPWPRLIASAGMLAGLVGSSARKLKLIRSHHARKDCPDVETLGAAVSQLLTLLDASVAENAVGMAVARWRGSGRGRHGSS